MAISAVAAAISTATVGFTTGAFIMGSWITHFLVTTALGAALNALAPKPKFSTGSGGYSLGGQSGAALDHQIIYGEARVGGVRVYDSSTGESNEYLHRIMAFAGHEVDSYTAIYLDDEPLTIDSETGEVTAPEKYVGFVRVLTRKGGSDNGTAIQELIDDTADLASNAGKWTAAHKLQGIAYVYVRFKYDQNAFPNGVPAISAKIRGKKVYDPNTDTTAWSDNPALCVRDYLTSDYGLAQPDSRIDDLKVIDAANICDQTVEGQSRYTCNGAFTTAGQPAQIITDLLSSMGGLVWYGQGKWRMKAAAWSTPSLSFNDDDLRSSISLSTRHSRRDNFNTVKGTFAGDETDWQATDYPLVTDPAYVTADNGIVNTLDFPLPFTSNQLTAQRVARIALNRNREQLTFKASFGLRALEVQVGDFINISNERFGWTDKAFEVVEWTFGLTQDNDIQVNMTLREISEAVFTGQNGEIIEGNNTTLPDPSSNLAITNLAANGAGQVQPDGTFIETAIVTWDAVSNAFVDYYEVEWRASYTSSYNSTTTTDNTIELTPLVSDVAYIIRVRAVTVSGIKGDWASVSFTAGQDNSDPALPTQISAEGGFEYIKLAWTNPADADFSHVEIWENDTDTLTGSTQVGISTGDTFVRTNLGTDVRKYYFLRSVDYTGNTSSYTTDANWTSGSNTAVTSFIDNNAFEGNVYSLFKEQGLYAIEDVDTLPASGSFDGEKVYNRADGKLYRWSTEPSWVPVSSEASFGNFNIRAPYDGQIFRDIGETLAFSGTSSSGYDVYNNGGWSNQSVFVSSTLPSTVVSGQYRAVEKTDRFIFAQQTLLLNGNGAPVYNLLEVSYGTASIGSVIGVQGKYYFHLNDEDLYYYDDGSWSIVPHTAATSVPTALGSTIYRLLAHDLYYGRAGGSWQPVIADSGLISADRIQANTITAGLLAASGIITNSAQINDAVIENANIANLAVDTIKVANDAITRHDDFSFSTTTGNQPRAFTSVISMPFAGSITAMATAISLGTTSSSSTLEFTLYIYETRIGGDELISKSYTATSSGAVGIYPILLSYDIDTSLVAANPSGFTVGLFMNSTNITNSEFDCDMVVLRRFK